jgi:hypothetical protein
VCPTGSFKSGTACTGFTAENSQTCSGGSPLPLPPPSSSFLLVSSSLSYSVLFLPPSSSSSLYLLPPSSLIIFKPSILYPLFCLIASDPSACGNGGANYMCSIGSYKSGSACSGSTNSDTQMCQSNFFSTLNKFL